MKVEAIENAICILHKHLPEDEVSFYEGVFNVFAVQFTQGNLDEKLYKEYLDDFIRVDGIERETLLRTAPEILKELDADLE